MTDRILRETTEAKSVIAFLNDSIGEDILQFDYREAMAKVSQLDAQQKAAVLAVCVPALSGKESSRTRLARIAAVRAIVVLLPLSLGAIADLLNRRLTKDHYEVHRTLFVYLSWTQEMPDASSLTKDVLRLVEDYLIAVPRETALAAWMAANMLGEDWDEEEAMPLLIRTAQGARYRVGRELSIMGLDNILDKLPAEGDAHKNILKTLRKISRSDRSASVRADAKDILKTWRAVARGEPRGFSWIRPVAATGAGEDVAAAVSTTTT
jgi:hypothetical protein